MTPVCACGCGRELLPLALAAGDPYHSRKCVEAVHGGHGAANRQQGPARSRAGRREPENDRQRARADADRARRGTLGIRGY